jgi:hypothetical protein
VSPAKRAAVHGDAVMNAVDEQREMGAREAIGHIDSFAWSSTARRRTEHHVPYRVCTQDG